MPRDLDGLADIVVLTVQNALGPILQRMAASEARVEGLIADCKALIELRDRVVAIETKADVPVPPDVLLSNRVLALETKTAQPSAAEILLADVQRRVGVLEQHEMPTPVAVVPTASVEDMSGVRSDVRELTKTIAAVSERVAVVETRSPVPGPQGKDGADGVHGKDGADGMGWDDLSVKHDGERTFSVQLIKGERVKDAGTFTIPAQIYRGVYIEGRTYEPGDVVSYGGSTWCCHKQTVLKPDASTINSETGKSMGGQGKDFWQMVVRAGRQGEPGKIVHTPTSTPVVSIGANR